MSNAVLAIVATEAKDAAKDEVDLVERIKKCMRASYRHWMATDENDQFSGAIAAAMVLSEGEDEERLRAAVDAQKALTALMQGVPVDMDAVLRRQERTEPISLQALWDEIKAESQP